MQLDNELRHFGWVLGSRGSVEVPLCVHPRQHFGMLPVVDALKPKFGLEFLWVDCACNVGTLATQGPMHALVQPDQGGARHLYEPLYLLCYPNTGEGPDSWVLWMLQSPTGGY